MDIGSKSRHRGTDAHRVTPRLYAPAKSGSMTEAATFCCLTTFPSSALSPLHYPSIRYQQVQHSSMIASSALQGLMLSSPIRPL